MTAPEVARVYAFRSTPHISLGWLWALLAGLVAGAVALGMFRRAEERRRAEPPPNTVRDAVALVGETLAATHNPDALLPVILQAAIEATEAAGGFDHERRDRSRIARRARDRTSATRSSFRCASPTAERRSLRSTRRRPVSPRTHATPRPGSPRRR